MLTSFLVPHIKQDGKLHQQRPALHSRAWVPLASDRFHPHNGKRSSQAVSSNAILSKCEMNPMDLLYLSPEFPPNFANFILQLNRHGTQVWALGEADFFDMPAPVRESIRYYVRTDLTSATAVEIALETLLDAKAAMGGPRRFDVVESHNEIWLGLEAHINRLLDIPGIRPEDLGRLKQKSAMKRQFMACGLRTAPGQRLKDAAHALELADALGFPLILKPDQGVGAGDIHKVTGRNQLEALLPGLGADYLMEGFVDAPMVSYDGLVDRNGGLLFENSLVYGAGVLDYVNGQDTFFYVDRRIPEPLSAIGRRLVKAFDIRRKFFHFEFFCLDGTFMPIEINCRPPGGAILDMMNYSVDDDLYAAYARMIMGREDPPVTASKAYYCAYVGRRERNYLFSHDQLVRRLGDALVEFGENPKIFQAAMSRWRYLIRSQSREQLLAMSADVQRLTD